MFLKMFHSLHNIKGGENICGCFSILGGFLIHLTYGYLYSLTNMVPYIMGYLITFMDPKLSVQTSVWFSAVSFALYGFSMPLGGFLSSKIGYRPVLALSCFLLSGGVLLSYFTVQKMYVGVILTYSFLFGTGVGLGFSVTLAVAATWFPKHRGLVVGLVVSGYGMGSLVFGPIQTRLINPNNVPVNNVTRQFDDPEVLTRLPNVFLILGAILLITQIIGFILLHPKPKFNFKEGRIEVLDEDSSLNSQIKDEEVKVYSNLSSVVNITPGQLFYHVDFYLLWFIELCNSVPLTLVTSSYKLFGQTFISDDKYLSTVVTVTAVFNSGGRILWGSVVDRFSYKVPFCAVSLTWAMLLFTLPWIGITSGLTARILYFVWGIGNFIFLSSVSTLAPATIGSMFGGKNMAVNYGIMATARAIGCPLCAFILTFINSRNLYFIQFTICGCASLIAFFLAVWIDDHKISSSLNCCSLCSKTCSKVRVQRK
ncbi:Oxalate:formate antiporter isoform 1 [Schistosoma japonicum]|uniref:Oxalate:formate antiporter isoform 1 n=2 Tax=Schistosoma japonicum TaxID=6182 RepID=A0A4Z2DWU4_SCHJA|nr:Oxalate:formate antiporter [Schistosoma japonicum]TNN20919.1 Oxalate:formate antiporter isoform 1 [Schistosoma japonicum]